MVEEFLDNIGMGAEDNLAGVQATEQLEETLETGAFGKVLRRLDREATRLRERLDRLETAKVWAGQNAGDDGPAEHLDQGFGLALALSIERAQAVVSFPLTPMTRLGVADEICGQRSAAAGGRSERSNARSRRYVRVSTASSTVSQRSSSTSTLGRKRPPAGSITQ